MHLRAAITYSMYTGIAGICKQSGWRQKLPSIYIQQLQPQSMQALPAFANSRAEYRNYQALYTAITHSMYKGISKHISPKG